MLQRGKRIYHCLLLLLLPPAFSSSGSMRLPHSVRSFSAESRPSNLQSSILSASLGSKGSRPYRCGMTQCSQKRIFNLGEERKWTQQPANLLSWRIKSAPRIRGLPVNFPFSERVFFSSGLGEQSSRFSLAGSFSAVISDLAT